MKIANNLTTWIAILGSLPLAAGGISKGIDIVRHDLIGIARNEEEAFQRHLMSDHFMSEEKAYCDVISAKNGFVVVNMFPDGCVTIKRKDENGNIVSMKVLPEPGKVDKIKEIYSDNSGIVYASEVPFKFGVHLGDFDYVESKKGSSVLRVYGDSCILRYEFSIYGASQRWKWIRYNHGG